MVLPVTDHAGRARPAGAGTVNPAAAPPEHHMVATAAADGAAIDQEFLGGQASLARELVQGFGVVAQLRSSCASAAC